MLLRFKKQKNKVNIYFNLIGIVSTLVKLTEKLNLTLLPY